MGEVRSAKSPALEHLSPGRNQPLGNLPAFAELVAPSELVIALRLAPSEQTPSSHLARRVTVSRLGITQPYRSRCSPYGVSARIRSKNREASPREVLHFIATVRENLKGWDHATKRNPDLLLPLTLSVLPELTNDALLFPQHRVHRLD